ncbi:MAG: Ig-like domain-containing protein, partial [Pseudomonadota bacterium]
MAFGVSARFFDITFGSFGNDTIVTGDGRDLVFGLFGSDWIDAGGGNDRVWAGWGDDTVDGGAGHDRIDAGRGNDLVIGGAGNDVIDGGRGEDTAAFHGSVFDYTITSGSRITHVVGADGSDRLKRVEVLQFDDATLFLDGRNNAVIARDDAATTDENTVLTLTAVDLAANDFDIDGDALEVTDVSATSTEGVAVTLVDGIVTYDPGTAFDSLGKGETATDTFTYSVTDNQGSTTTGTVTITITGTNDAPVLTLPDTAEIAENTTGVVAAARVTDSEDDTVILGLSGADAAFFSIEQNTGVISLNGALDFEAPLDADGDNIYDVTVTADDQNGGIVSATIAISVTDEVEGPFSITQSFETENDGGFYTDPNTDGNLLPADT